MTIWFETNDLFVHFDWNLHPTGIQRVALALMAAARKRMPEQVAFCRIQGDGRLAAVDFTTVMAAGAEPPPRRAPRWLQQIARFIYRRPARRLGDWGGTGARDFADLVRPGDTLVCIGLPWKDLRYGDRVAEAKARHRLRFALVVYDVLPLTNPEFSATAFVAAFSQWFDRVIPATDLLLAGADYVATSVRLACTKRGLRVPPIERVVFGAGFGEVAAVPAPSAPMPDGFVLYVSTIGARKNHSLLLRVWQRLIERHGATAIPVLVFLGTGGDLGWLRAEIDASASLRDKIKIWTNASDAMLRKAYRQCRFTVYPSLAEGWGLPVAESLAAGKFCVASNRTSLPEVGGDWIDYFDPANDDDALSKIERAIIDSDYLANRTARIVQGYRPPNWDCCADGMIQALAAISHTTAPAPRIWFDVGFLIEHFTWNRRANGMQRVGLELARAAKTALGDRLTFCRLRLGGAVDGIDVIHFHRLEAVCVGGEFIPPGWRRWRSRLGSAAMAVASNTLGIGRGSGAMPAQGDIFLCVGAGWSKPSYRNWMMAARKRLNFRFAVLIHDVIPYTHPELVWSRFVDDFVHGFQATITLADLVLVYSDFTAHSIRNLCRDKGWPAPKIERIHFGDGFASATSGDVSPLTMLPANFALFVSSIEDRRKNHILLVRVWRRLLERHGGTVPALVFIGTGSLIDAVAAEIRQHAGLHDKIVVVSNASDEQLRDAYRRCLFTLYPSLVEGWGLPVAEALTFGKFCVASNRASLPEIAGDLIDYFDPENEDEAYARVERVLYEPGYLETRTARIATEYHPATWLDCVAELVAKLDEIP